MLTIVTPGRDEIQALQKSEGIYYWSACVEGFLRKHGLVSLVHAGMGDETPGYLVVTRGLVPRADEQRRPAFYEGPVAASVLEAHGVRAVERMATVAQVFDEKGMVVGRLAYPVVRVRRIPKQWRDRPDPYVFMSTDPRWNGQRVRWQALSVPRGWRPLAWVRSEEGGGEDVVAITDGMSVICGLPVFDLIGSSHAFPGLDAGYYDVVVPAVDFDCETWLFNLLVDHVRAAGVPLVTVDRWPTGSHAAFTIRHDYDRLIPFWDVARLLWYYRRRGMKCSWGFLANQCRRLDAWLVRWFGHEINLHSAAGDFEGFMDELAKVAHASGLRVGGFTVHGGAGAAGWLGDVQFDWAERAGLEYGEMLGRINAIPHPINRLVTGIPVVSRLVTPAVHLGLDAGTRPEAHYLPEMQEVIPRLLARGEHVVLMSHPDIHVRELKRLVDVLDLRGVWRATLAEVARWCRVAKFESRCIPDAPGIELLFGDPLPVATTVKLLLPEGEEQSQVVSQGTVRAQIAGAFLRRRELIHHAPPSPLS